MKSIICSVAMGVVLLAGVGGGWARDNTDSSQAALARIGNPPLGLAAVPIPGDNLPTPEKIQLGRKLFFDSRLSVDGKLACGTCHLPEFGFTVNDSATSIGKDGAVLRRNAPTVLNVAYQRSLFLDGRRATIEEQALDPLVAPDEMGNPSLAAVVATIRSLSDYDGMFQSAFGDGPTPHRIGQAIASYERTLLAANSPFDRWYFGNEQGALGAQAIQGFKLFKGKAGCSACHALEDGQTLFTDHQFHDVGIGWQRSRVNTAGVGLPPTGKNKAGATPGRAEFKPLPTDLGRMEVTRIPDDLFRYRTPSLRNVALTAPYMHDGSLPSLTEVVIYYNRGGFRNYGIDRLVRPLSLDAGEIAAVVAFLKSLTSGDVQVLIAEAHPSTNANP